MDRLLIDTNIIIDLLSQRDRFYKEAQELFTLADHKEVELIVSSLSFANTQYILSRSLSSAESRNILIKFKLLVEVVPLDDKIIELSLLSKFKDYEDAIQYYTALANNANIIISRNKKDFKEAKLPVMTAREYLNSRS